MPCRSAVSQNDFEGSTVLATADQDYYDCNTCTVNIGMLVT